MYELESHKIETWRGDSFQSKVRAAAAEVAVAVLPVGDRHRNPSPQLKLSLSVQMSTCSAPVASSSAFLQRPGDVLYCFATVAKRFELQPTSQYLLLVKGNNILFKFDMIVSICGVDIAI